jgi:hypothetical protein
MSSVTIDVTAKATEVARKAGAIYPEAIAEYIRNDLAVVDSAAGPQVVFRNGIGYEPLDFVMSRLKITENVGALFHGGKLDIKNLSHDLYRAIRQHNPELIGLRHKRRFV